MISFNPDLSRDITNQQNGFAPSEDSDQPGHPPSLIRVFAVRMKKAWLLSYPLSAQRRLIRLGRCPSDLSLRLAHTHFVGFVVMRLIFPSISPKSLSISSVNLMTFCPAGYINIQYTKICKCLQSIDSKKPNHRSYFSVPYVCMSIYGFLP